MIELADQVKQKTKQKKTGSPVLTNGKRPRTVDNKKYIFEWNGDLIRCVCQDYDGYTVERRHQEQVGKEMLTL